ncbi:polysaccharide deacetylase family protein [Hydrogenophaga sp. RAC07]|uniref:polysaccharide deacetylase family protein n=1 Tax=Hydrogenophaga sp. RAC07 TaxID=1842537 RepID=UPI001F00F842|nr:polysaccharide deacetylase family protein [Hydrogenophaga sp. RAC07]
MLPNDPDISTFRWQMQLLSSFFNVIPLDLALAGLRDGTIPPRAVCITFDDGYRSIHDLALPILLEYELPATVFVSSGYIGHGAMWNDRIIEAIRGFEGGSLDLPSVDFGVLSCGTVLDRQKACETIIGSAKYLAPDLRESLTREIEMHCKVSIEPNLMLTKSMLRALVGSGIEIGAHTVSHPILSNVSDESARREIAESKRVLEATIDGDVRYFAYPNGKFGKDFDLRHVKMVKDAGFEAAFTSSSGGAAMLGDDYQLCRCMPWDRSPAAFGIRLFRWLYGV